MKSNESEGREEPAEQLEEGGGKWDKGEEGGNKGCRGRMNEMNGGSENGWMGLSVCTS